MNRLHCAVVALLCLLELFAPAGAQAQERQILSTAMAQYSIAGQGQEQASNTVVLTVGEALWVMRTLHASPAGIALPVAGAADCPSSRGGGQTLVVAPTSSVYVGETLVVEVTSAALNASPSAIDRPMVRVAGSDGAALAVELVETGNDTGIFRAQVTTRADGSTAGCGLAVAAGGTIAIELLDTLGRAIPVAEVAVLADPYGIVFDSADGLPVSGATVRVVDAAGLPARVLAPDGVTSWPSVMVSGQAVTDGAGQRHEMAPGEYRFPLLAQGTYRIEVSPPAPYTAPSTVDPERLARLRHANGEPMALGEGSFGRAFTLAGTDPLRIDIPVDRPAGVLGLAHSASRTMAEAGDAVVYTAQLGNGDLARARSGTVLQVRAGEGLRLVAGSVRIDGQPVRPADLATDADGRGFSLAVDRIEPAATRPVTYALRVADDAPGGPAESLATLTDSVGTTRSTAAAIRVEQATVAGTMAIAGRVALGGCGNAGPGVARVRILLEDGSFAVTDAEGRYHFEGVAPGTHVVRLAQHTLPRGARVLDCGGSVRAAGSATSRFVTGQGGSLAVANFAIEGPAASADPAPAAIHEGEAAARKAAGADVDWLALGDGPDGFLFPAEAHNPRAPALRVVARHRTGVKPVLAINGRPVPALALDGTLVAAGGGHAVTVWRGIPLQPGTNLVRLDLPEGGGRNAASFERRVHYAGAPMRAEILRARSRLVADGVTQPVIALRFTDRDGQPVRSGITGTFTVNAPYESAAAAAALQLSQLGGVGNSGPRWTVEGDDGVALVPLSPTMASGALRIGLSFSDGEVRREQQLDDWIVPGDVPWTLVALAEGTIGKARIDRSRATHPTRRAEGRGAFYAKGRVLGRYLLTAAYDTAKEDAGQRLLGTIDPRSYYTVFGDASARRFDAASREKLYVRIESAGFAALYGDFVSGFDRTDLAAYHRAATGVTAEARRGPWHVQAFAAEVASRHRRDELQGSGLSGPYRLSRPEIVPGSERVAVEVRDRFRSDVIVRRTELARFLDYDIDLASGTLRLSRPLLSRDAELNPQFLVIDYEVDDGRGEASLAAGLRAEHKTPRTGLHMGATVLTDRNDDGGSAGRETLVAVDLRRQVGPASELRAELGASFTGGSTALAWQVEGEHHSGALDVLAYARSIAPGYGTAQQNMAEQGRRKLGLDTRLALSRRLSLTASAWHDEDLAGSASRTALQAAGMLRTGKSDLRMGISHFRDRFAMGGSGQSTVLEGGVTRRLWADRLELSASSSLALGTAASPDLPTRHQLGARLSVSRDVRLLASYEIARAHGLDSRTFSGGFELSPWTGGRVTTTLGAAQIGELGTRTYAAAGLAQTFQLTRTLAIDATLDGNRRIGAAPQVPVLNPAHPLASGGQLGADGSRFESFTAATLGASWRQGPWSASARGEWRDGEEADRRAFAFGLVRQLGEGRVLGSSFLWSRAEAGGTASETMDAALTAAWRPAASPFSFLSKVEFRSDSVTGAVAGRPAPASGSALALTGDGRMRRLVASLAGNFTPRGAAGSSGRDEVAVFLAVRQSFDRVQGYDLKGTGLLAGLDARRTVAARVELGVSVSARANLTGRTTDYAYGPTIGVSPAKGAVVTLGYNVRGFDDPDFGDARYTRQGLFVTVRAKFDEGILPFARR